LGWLQRHGSVPSIGGLYASLRALIEGIIYLGFQRCLFLKAFLRNLVV